VLHSRLHDCNSRIAKNQTCGGGGGGGGGGNLHLLLIVDRPCCIIIILKILVVLVLSKPFSGVHTVSVARCVCVVERGCTLGCLSISVQRKPVQQLTVLPSLKKLLALVDGGFNPDQPVELIVCNVLFVITVVSPSPTQDLSM